MVGTMVKNPLISEGDARDVGLTPGSEISPGVGNGNPRQYFCMGKPMDKGAWWATVHGVAKSRIRLNDFTFTFRAEGASITFLFGKLHPMR